MSASEMNTAEWRRDIATPEGSRVAIAMTRAVREALGMFAGAMPITPREAFEQALEEAERLRAALVETRRVATPVIDRLEGLNNEEFSEVVLRAAAAGEDALSVWKLLAIEGARRLVRPG